MDVPDMFHVETVTVGFGDEVETVEIHIFEDEKWNAEKLLHAINNIAVGMLKRMEDGFNE